MNGYSNDACLIDPRLEVSPPESSAVDDTMGYWPHYSSISSSCRGRYLKWLAGGRNDPQVDMGCVFLFFYGLERRLLVDGLNGKFPAEERAQIVDEVRRLRNLYSESNSFQNYSSAFLAMEWVLYRRDEPLPDYLRGSDRVGMVAFRIMLAQHASHGEPLPESMALQWLSLRPDYYTLRTPTRRCKSEFEELFNIRYKEKFGEGLIVKPGTKSLGRSYSAASPSVRMPHDLRVANLHDLFKLNGPLRRIKDVVESCTVDLEPYSRLRARPQVEQTPLALAARLPAPLTFGVPEFQRLKSYLGEACRERPAMISTKALYEIWDEEPPKSFGKKESEDLMTLVEAAGFGIAPHIRYHNMKLAPDGSAVIFPGGHGKDFQPSNEFCMMVTILRLGALVTQIDQDVSPAEEEVLQRLVNENQELRAVDKRSLSAFLLWSLGTAQTAAGLKKGLADVSEVQKTAIGRILVSVAKADGRIDPGEVKELEKLYIALGLERERVAGDIYSVAISSEPVTVGLREPAPAYAIPSAEAEPSPVFALNVELIRLIEEETKQAKELLVDIFASQDEAAEVPESANEQDQGDPLEELDGTYRELLKRLLKDST